MLNKGTIIYYSNKKDAMHDTNRKGSYFLNNAFIKEYQSNNNQDFPAYSWTINYTNGRKHTLSSAIPIKKKTEHLINEVNASGAIGSGSEQKKSKRTHLNPLERKKVKFLFLLWINFYKKSTKKFKFITFNRIKSRRLTSERLSY